MFLSMACYRTLGSKISNKDESLMSDDQEGSHSRGNGQNGSVWLPKTACIHVRCNPILITLQLLHEQSIHSTIQRKHVICWSAVSECVLLLVQRDAHRGWALNHLSFNAHLQFQPQASLAKNPAQGSRNDLSRPCSSPPMPPKFSRLEGLPIRFPSSSSCDSGSSLMGGIMSSSPHMGRGMFLTGMGCGMRLSVSVKVCKYGAMDVGSNGG